MADEIEYKFLVKDCSIIDNLDDYVDIVQGYFVTEQKISIRIRLKNNQAFFCIKGKTETISSLKVRKEFEYEIPYQDGVFMIENYCKNHLIEKRRYYKKFDKLTWEIDVFKGRYNNLIVAELEVPSLDTKFELPNWIGENVSDKFEYTNRYLALKE